MAKAVDSTTANRHAAFPHAERERYITGVSLPSSSYRLRPNFLGVPPTGIAAVGPPCRRFWASGIVPSVARERNYSVPIFLRQRHDSVVLSGNQHWS